MATSVSAIGAPTAATYAVEVTAKEHDQKKLEGQQAVQLIQSATPLLATSGSVGTKVNFTA